MIESEDLAFVKKERKRSITHMSDDQALQHIGKLIDMSRDAGYENGVLRALILLATLDGRQLHDRYAVIALYLRANAHDALTDFVENPNDLGAYDVHIQNQMLALSRAVSHKGFELSDPLLQCKVLTNYANLLCRVGRHHDAIAMADKALLAEPLLDKALASRGHALESYSRSLPREWEGAVLALHALDAYRAAAGDAAIAEDPNCPHTRSSLSASFARLSGCLNEQVVRSCWSPNDGSLGRSKQERAYRAWALEQCLFLNPFNDLGPVAVAATDSLTLPTLHESLSQRPGSYGPPPIFGLFSQMKQEYVSARYMLYEGVSQNGLHFADRDVVLSDTYDSPVYTLASERVRTAFRITYSLFDKVAFAIDHYWGLGHPPKNLTFRSVWQAKGAYLMHCGNVPLAGLFWLSMELFDPDLKVKTGADARQLHDIRNALEHTYLRLYPDWQMDSSQLAQGELGMSLGFDALVAKSVRVLQLVRAALFNLCHAIDYEQRQSNLGNDHLYMAANVVMPIDDCQKRTDHL